MRRFPGALLLAFTTGTVVGGVSVAYWEHIALAGSSAYAIVVNYLSSLPPAIVNFVGILSLVVSIAGLFVSLIQFFPRRSGKSSSEKPDPIPPTTSPDGAGSSRPATSGNPIAASLMVNGTILTIPRINIDNKPLSLWAIGLLMKGMTRVSPGFSARYGGASCHVLTNFYVFFYRYVRLVLCDAPKKLLGNNSVYSLKEKLDCIIAFLIGHIGSASIIGQDELQSG